jgi:hypothetical protein
MLLTLVVAALLQASDPNGGSQFLSYFHGEQWNFVVSQEALNASPSWAADADEPPLAPRSAVRAATQQLQQLGLDAAEWHVMDITLRQTGRTADKWVYVIAFGERSLSPIGGLATTCRIVVLMDGTTVTPKREPWPRR